MLQKRFSIVFLIILLTLGYSLSARGAADLSLNRASINETINWNDNLPITLTITNTGDSDLEISLRPRFDSNNPDNFGYYFKDNCNSTQDPVYFWDDISKTGEKIISYDSFTAFEKQTDKYGKDRLDNEKIVTKDLTGLHFWYYGLNYSKVSISSHGYLYLGDSLSKRIDAFHKEFNFDTNSTVYYLEKDGKVIVQYDNVRYRIYGGTKYIDKGSSTFQIVLNSNGRIDFYYQKKSDAISSWLGDTSITNGSTVINYSSSSISPGSGLAIEFRSYLKTSCEPIVIPASNTHTVDLAFDTKALRYYGVYNFNLEITHNVPNKEIVIVPVTITINEPPIVPASNLRATVEFDSVYLSWDCPLDYQQYGDSMKIVRSTSSGPAPFMPTPDQGTVIYNGGYTSAWKDPGLPTGTYYYTIYNYYTNYSLDESGLKMEDIYATAPPTVSAVIEQTNRVKQVFQPNGSGTATVDITLLTATNNRGLPYVDYNGNLMVGKHYGGSIIYDSWLYAPDLPSKIPSGATVVRATLKLNGNLSMYVVGDGNKEQQLQLFQITDPDKLGAPVFGQKDGYSYGLDFGFRDHRPGMDLPWKAAGVKNNITDILPEMPLIEAINFIPNRVYSVVEPFRFDVTKSVQDWIKKTNPNQGWFLTFEPRHMDKITSHCYFNFYGVDYAKPEYRPSLEIVFTFDPSDLDPPGPAINPGATVIDISETREIIKFQWTKPQDQDFAGVRIVGKCGSYPVDPDDGVLIYDGNKDSCYSVGNYYQYYALFTYDYKRNYGQRQWLQAINLDTQDPNNPQPKNLNVTANGEKLSLSWDPFPNAFSYLIYREDSQGVAVKFTSATHFYDDYHVSSSRTYKYRIVGICRGYQTMPSEEYGPVSPQSDGSLTMLEKPGVSFVKDNTQSPQPFCNKLTWKSASQNETGFVIEKRQNGDAEDTGWKELAAVDFTVTSLTDTAVEPNKDYQYRIKAVKGDGYSDYCESDWLTTPDFLMRPLNLKCEIIAAGRVLLSWDKSPNATGYIVSVEQIQSDGFLRDIQKISTGGTSSYVSGLTPEQLYSFSVRSINSYGTSDAADTGFMIATPHNPEGGLL